MKPLNLRDVLDDLAGGALLSGLEIGEDEVVERVDVVHHRGAAMDAPGPFARGGDGGEVRGDRFLPHPEPRVDVRRHVQRVRHPGRDFAVALRRLQPARSERRVVVGVDDVMRDARMIRVLFEERLENGGGLKLIGEGEIGRGARCR